MGSRFKSRYFYWALPIEGKDTSFSAAGKGTNQFPLPGYGIRDTSDWKIPANAAFAGKSVKNSKTSIG